MNTSLLQSKEKTAIPTEGNPIDLVPLKEAAVKVNRNESTIRHWIEIGKIQSWKVAGKKTSFVSLKEVQDIDQDSARIYDNADPIQVFLDRQRQLADCRSILDEYEAKRQKRLNAVNYDRSGLVGGAA